MCCTYAGCACTVHADARTALLAFRDTVNAEVLERACGIWNETGPGPCPLQGQGNLWGCVLCTPPGDLEGLHIDLDIGSSQAEAPPGFMSLGALNSPRNLVTRGIRQLVQAVVHGRDRLPKSS